ncbi:hypothetical protein PG999_004283 [Apiospora kogelbergensis]|uniref:Carboxymuconolactone decarboxylase-like domain-containing protein n=1 Tax=Apiospora kogelbergensis TaxID=1337665 RepID=A0AAW0QYX9_9PEZI
METTQGSSASSASSVHQKVHVIFRSIEDAWSLSGLGPNRWYLLTIAVLAGGNDPELSNQLYLYLIAKPEFSTPAQRQALVRELREALIKCVSLVGVCKPLEAIMAINAQERPEDKDPTPVATREGWQCDVANLERGMSWMSKIYTGDANSTIALFDDHRDFAWISQNITYGLYLSDRQVLDDLGTEIIVLAAIMIQNLPKETRWHIRGIRRLGVSIDDVKVVWNAVHIYAQFLGIKLNRVPTVEEVESEV